MKNLSYKEEVLSMFTDHNFSLNKYDLKFITHLQILISKNNFVTSNQNTLLDKLIAKYKKQINKNKFFYEGLSKLPWQTKLIDSDKEHTEAFVNLVDDELIVKVPFNKKLITKLTETIPDYQLIWDKTKKQYAIEYSTEAFKKIVTIIPLFYKTNYCDKLQKVLDYVNSFGDVYWCPTLVNINNFYYIIACNDALYELTKDIVLSDDPKVLLKLSGYGININPRITNNPVKLFASSMDTSIDIDQISVLNTYMKELGLTNVVCNYRIERIKAYKTQVENDLKNYKITYTNSKEELTENIQNAIFLYIGTDYFRGRNYQVFDKYVRIVNSRSININERM